MLIMSVLTADCCNDAVPVSINPIPRLCAAARCLVAAVAGAALQPDRLQPPQPQQAHIQHTSGQGSFTPPQPLSSRGQGLCWRVWWWCVMCPMSVYLRSCVPVCVCRVPSVYPEICGQSSAAVTILLCCIQARGGRVPRRARKGLAPCRATAEPPRRAGGSSRAAAAGPSGATTYLQSEPSPTQRILNTTHSKFQILPIALIW